MGEQLQGSKASKASTLEALAGALCVTQSRIELLAIGSSCLDQTVKLSAGRRATANSCAR